MSEPGRALETGPTEAPCVPAPAVIVMRVTAHGGVHDGLVLGWRGDRVYVPYRTADGNHLAWVAGLRHRAHLARIHR